MISIDGSYGEGGGSILRLATAFAIIIHEPIKVINIRKKRKVPGLRSQHLTALQALKELCGGTLENATVGAKEITFIPGRDWKSSLNLKISTAGSIGLVAQALQIAIASTKNFSLDLTINGGATFGKWAPSVPWLQEVTWKLFSQLGLEINAKIEKHGFYPKGGAKVKIDFKTFNGINEFILEDFHRPKRLKISSIVSSYLKKAKVAERQIIGAEKILKKNDFDIESNSVYVETLNAGSGIVISSEEIPLGADNVGEKRISAEKIGLIAANRFLETIEKQCIIDPFLADQLIPILSLSPKTSSFNTPKLTKHIETNIYLAKKLLNVDIKVVKKERNYTIIINP